MVHMNYFLAAINLYYQRAYLADEFVIVKDTDGMEKYKPCKKGEGLSMTYLDIVPGKLLPVPLSYDDLHFVLKNTRPTISFWQIRKMKQFERRNCNITILDGKISKPPQPQSTNQRWYHIFQKCCNCCNDQ